MSRVRFVSALIGLAALARGISFTSLRPLNWDEIEYFRATDWVRRGWVPYRDFFEHHTPLQWFVFAPVTALVRSPGASAIIAIRWAQVPLWIATFWLMSMWMRRAGLSLVARLSAIALALCSSMFMLAAVEFRVDALACTLLAGALVLSQRGSFGWGGAALVLAGFANIRLGPLLVVALFALALQHRDGVTRLLAGVVAALAACALYFVGTGTTGIAWQRLIVDNYVADQWAQRTPGIFLHRLLIPLGVTAAGFVPSAIDPPTILIFGIGLIGIVNAIRRRQSQWLLLAVIQIANLMFIAMMKFVQTYHFEAVFVVMLPLVAWELDQWKREKAIIGVLAVLVGFSVAVSVFRGKEEDLRYQDLIMREADRLTPSEATVFDGAGWALHRKPAYRYWFLREIIRVLEAHGRLETYRVDPANPPAALITDYGARLWLATHPELRRYFMAHYLPYWRDLWLPGMSAVIHPGTRATWIVPADDEYVIYASPAFAGHPWFRGRVTGFVRFRDGRRVTLRRGALYTIGSNDSRPIGVFIVPARRKELFLQPPDGVDIDAAPPPRWHLPKLW
ncbi:MAG TPA: hypothetical protein VF975_09265 [Thermoanaerobaculia bacterium]